jgi:hypothetical protein
MRYKISKYIISSLFLLATAATVNAQYSDSYNSQQQQRQQQQGTPKEKKPKGPQLDAPFFNGLYVGVDLYGLGSNVLGSDFLSSEVQVGVNLKNRFMPTVELGYGHTNKWNENGIHYKSNAPYVRFGIDYNIRFKKLDYEDWLFLGVRYGYSSYKYDIGNAPIVDPAFGDKIENPNLIDPIWGGSSIPYHENGITGNMSWYEFIGGVRTKIWKNLFMSWTIRLKYRIKAKESFNSSPWYVPGFGKFSSSANGMTYSIIYKFSLGAKQPKVFTPVDKTTQKRKGKRIVRRSGSAPFNAKK